MVNRLFQEAVADAQAGRLSEAAEKIDTVLAITGPHPDILWNLGTWRAQLGQHDRALAAWDGYRRLVPDDWRARPKVIQACQALGDTARLERERAELLALHRAGADPGLAEEPHYCREQFRVGDRPVVAYEVFDPSGPQRVFYAFLVGEPDGTMIGRYSLGSYEWTTQFARENGSIGPDERYYHLDWYAGPLHSTLGFYTFLPGYERVRSDVVAALAGEIRPTSHSIRPEPPENADEPDAAPSGDAPPPPRPAPEPTPTPPPTPTREPTSAPTPGAGESGGGGGGPFSALGSWISRMMGRRDDRPN